MFSAWHEMLFDILQDFIPRTTRQMKNFAPCVQSQSSHLIKKFKTPRSKHQNAAAVKKVEHVRTEFQSTYERIKQVVKLSLSAKESFQTYICQKSLKRQSTYSECYLDGCRNYGWSQSGALQCVFSVALPYSKKAI